MPAPDRVSAAPETSSSSPPPATGCLHPRHGATGRFYLPEVMAPAPRCSITTTTATSTSFWCRPARSTARGGDEPSVSHDLAGGAEGRRPACFTRDRARRRRPARPTAWARRSAITTTNGHMDLSSPHSAPTRSITAMATDIHRCHDAGRRQRRQLEPSAASSTTTATAGSISSSPTTLISRSRQSAMQRPRSAHATIASARLHPVPDRAVPDPRQRQVAE